MSTGKGTCSVPDCGRHVRARGLCQTHWKRLKTTGKADGPIKPVRPPRRGAVKVGGRSLTQHCADTLKRHAEQHGDSITAVITDVLERWARRRKRRK